MLDCLKYRPQLHHASNLGAPIAYRIAQKANCKAYIYDAVAVDEMEEIYRITGIKDIFRIGRGHNLNMRAAVLNLCEQKVIDYKDHNYPQRSFGRRHFRRTLRTRQAGGHDF